jgi:hypothetical protein
MLEARLAIQSRQQLWSAISVVIGDANDVYVNYLGDAAERHVSCHASGQQHQKVVASFVAHALLRAAFTIV